MRLSGRLVLFLVGALTVAVRAAPSPPATPVEPAPPLRAAGGTYVFSMAGEPPGTAVLYAWRVSTEMQEVQFSLQGPPGWNNGELYTWKVTRSRPGLYVWKEELTAIPAAPGVYVLTAEMDGSRERARFSVAPGPPLVAPDVQVTVDEQRVIRVAWTPVPETRSYEVGFTNLLGQPLIRTFSRGKLHAFYTHFAPGGYRARVAAYTFDFTQRVTEALVMPQQFHGVEASTEFTMP